MSDFWYGVVVALGAVALVAFAGGLIYDTRRTQRQHEAFDRNERLIKSFDEVRQLLFHGEPARQGDLVFSQLDYEHVWIVTLIWESDTYRHEVRYSSHYNEASWCLILKDEEPEKLLPQPGYGGGLRAIRFVAEDLLAFPGFTAPSGPDLDAAPAS